ncbi:MAG: DUF1330 domain-containing protein [Chloroflexota bacterium]|nr:DUF1330 domain-containing protein [Chloroflexota bacterium]
MAGYVIVDNQVTDAEVYAEFREKVAGTVEAHGGRYLVRGGSAEAIEGDWAPERLIVIEFESVAKIRTWLASPEFTELREIRHRSATANVIVVEGV